ncbi:uncharacterized protein LOC143375412 [Andrena cerasifolii]|uniref:uncharacterized protein LOC143375412 n=1 Tax=Andrena cerasifolii TaxID=2819439 RepID=UPI0040378769
MFESDDWDLDQEFMNDVDSMSLEYYSQSEPKRRKTETSDDPSCLSNTGANYKTMDIDGTITKCKEDKESRKNLILGMFNKSLSDKDISPSALPKSRNSSENNLLKSHSETRNYGTSQLPRKDLVLDLLKKKNIQDKVVQQNTRTSEPRKAERRIKSNGDINVRDSARPNNRVKLETPNKCLQEKDSSSSDKQSPSANSRKQLLFNILKQRSAANAASRNDDAKKNVSAIKLTQAQPSVKTTLVRRFPGPAGLLPDNIDPNIPAISYLNNLEENEDDTKESKDTDIPEYCSQNTEDLFTDGAWQLMLNDLPDGFLKGYEIATIKKQMGRVKRGYNAKVDFLAGIVERIDHSHDNPPLILKDFTGSIHGIIHRDIHVQYPGLLEANAVLLLHDVGILKSSGSFVTNKCRILISPSNLLAIYRNDGKIERTHYMESALRNVANGESEDEEVEGVDTEDEESPETSCKSKAGRITEIKETANVIKNPEDSNEKSSTWNTSLNETFDNMSDSIDFDLIDDFSFSVSSSNITNSQNEKNFNSSVSKNFKCLNKENKQQDIRFCVKGIGDVGNCSKQKAENLLQSLKRFSPNANARKKFSHNPGSLQMDVKHPTASACSRDVESEVLGNASSESNVNRLQGKTGCMAKELHTPCHDKAKSVEFNSSKNRPSIRSKLKAFKNPDVPTQSLNFETDASSDLKSDNKSQKSPNSARDMLCSAENDTDDEMLSQLDIDTICTNYNDNS